MTEYYKDKLEAGLEYQDFISDQLRVFGIFIGAYSSRKYQYGRGESASGIEVKFDGRLKETGNLYIEIAEKSNAALDEYTSSGIFRNDNTYLYLIGDYEQAYLFSKHQLQFIYQSKESWKRRGICEAKIDTSKGFLYPAVSAVRSGTCLKHFIFKKAS